VRASRGFSPTPAATAVIADYYWIAARAVHDGQVWWHVLAHLL